MLGIGRSGKDDQRRWCRFNPSVSAREGRRRDEVFPEDEAVWRCGSVDRRRGGMGGLGDDASLGSYLAKK
jgi:hypothetical protein